MTHEEFHFEVLAALAVAGQLSEAELLGLEQHVAQCPPCTRLMSEMEVAGRQLFLMTAHRAKGPSTPVGMQERFLMRAINAGVPLSRPPLAHRYRHVSRFAPIAVALALILSLSWNAVFERHSTVTGDFVSGPMASAPISALPQIATADKRSNSLLAIRRPGKTQHLRKRLAQIPAEALTFASLDGDQSNKKVLFHLNSALFPKISTTADTVAGIPTDFHPLTGDYLVSGYDRPQKLQALSFSAPTLWSISGQKDSNKRVFHYTATLASLSFLDYGSDLRWSKESAHDVSSHNAFSQIRSR